MSRDDGALGKGEAEHAPSPLQQERDDVTRRNTLQAVWSGATKAKSRGRCNRSVTMWPGETHFRRFGAERQKQSPEAAATGAWRCDQEKRTSGGLERSDKNCGEHIKGEAEHAPSPLQQEHVVVTTCSAL